MQALLDSLGELRTILPLLVTLTGASLVLGLAHWLLIARGRHRMAELSIGRPLAMLFLTGLAIVAVILALPVEDSTRGQLLSLLGLVLTAMIALSSTSFVANAMAGLLLRVVGNFRPGDFVHVGAEFGRVTERGLFHTEIQTEDRDLTTLPNLYLVTNPVRVVRHSGTIVSATVSLGYGVAHERAEELLRQAAETAGLQEPFVHVVALGDVWVEYRAAGLLEEVKQLLSARSRLRAAILDTLHGEGIEIMSPTIMDQRRVEAGTRYVPSAAAGAPAATPEAEEAAETLAFDKAEQAEATEELRSELAALDERLAAARGPERESLEARREALAERLRAATEDEPER